MTGRYCQGTQPGSCPQLLLISGSSSARCLGLQMGSGDPLLDRRYPEDRGRCPGNGTGVLVLVHGLPSTQCSRESRSHHPDIQLASRWYPLQPLALLQFRGKDRPGILTKRRGLLVGCCLYLVKRLGLPEVLGTHPSTSTSSLQVPCRHRECRLRPSGITGYPFHGTAVNSDQHLSGSTVSWLST